MLSKCICRFKYALEWMWLILSHFYYFSIIPIGYKLYVITMSTLLEIRVLWTCILVQKNSMILEWCYLES